MICAQIVSGLWMRALVFTCVGLKPCPNPASDHFSVLGENKMLHKAAERVWWDFEPTVFRD